MVYTCLLFSHVLDPYCKLKWDAFCPQGSLSLLHASASEVEARKAWTDSGETLDWQRDAKRRKGKQTGNSLLPDSESSLVSHSEDPREHLGFIEVFCSFWLWLLTPSSSWPCESNFTAWCEMVRWGAHKVTTQSDNNWLPEKVHVAETCRDYQNREFASSPVESIFQLQVVQIQLCKYISCTYNICTSCIERSTARPRFESRAMPCHAMACHDRHTPRP